MGDASTMGVNLSDDNGGAAAAAAVRIDGAAQILPWAAQRDQQQIQSVIEQLHELARDLELVIRQEIRSALAEEFQALGGASSRAAQALEAVRRAASVRVALWAVAVVGACSAIPVTISWTALPSRGELVRMRAERDRLEANIALLEQRGGNIDLRRCGPTSRLCVRVERAAPAYGAQSDYLVVKGN
jgi:hypothetical protein